MPTDAEGRFGAMIEHSGGDPSKVLPLLWRRNDTEGKQHLGRKPGSSVDAIVAAALRLADTAGLDALSMSRLAAALGVGTMTLYTYVPGKAELIDLMVDAALRERELRAVEDSHPRTWRDRVELYADRTRAMFRRHPWLLRISPTHPPLGPGTMDAHEYLLRTLSGLGLTPTRAAEASHALTVMIDAMIRVEVAGERVEHDTDESREAWWQARMPFWQNYFDPDRYPAIFATWNDGGFDSADASEAGVYRFGLARLLDGIETVLRTTGNAGR